VEIDDRTMAYLRRFGETENEPLRAARARSEEADIPAISTNAGAVLRLMARITRARHVCEVGTGGGYSGLWILGGMDARGSLTTIELDPQRQSLAQQAFSEGGYGDRVRSMLGAALTVLPKLADGNYDIVFLDAVKAEYVDYLAHAKRLLRPGGVLVADNVLWDGKIADDTDTDSDTQALRNFNESVREDRTLQGAILPVGDGLLVAVYEPQ
jgi:predicted O-methyltransferase YrrM